jgi:hypothetical protein
MKIVYSICIAMFCLLLCADCANKRLAEKFEESAGLGSKSEMLAYLISPPLPKNGAGRFIAVTHQFAVETPEDELVKAWESVAKSCESMECEVLSSAVTRKTSTSPIKGELSLRVAPGHLNKLFDSINKSATVIEHSTESADKTAEVVDTEAKLKNHTEFRDRLRGMLAKSPGNIKELIEIERELTNVQSEIDSLSTTQKILQNQTLKVAVQISFRSKSSVTRTGTLAPIANAWDESGHVIAESIGSLITFVVALIPWLVLIIPAIWIIVRLLRKRSQSKRALTQNQSAPTQ